MVGRRLNEDAVRCVYWLNIGQINGRVGIRWEYYPHKRFKNWLPKFVEEPQMTLFFLAYEGFFLLIVTPLPLEKFRYVKGEANVYTVYLVNHKYKS